MGKKVVKISKEHIKELISEAINEAMKFQRTTDPNNLKGNVGPKDENRKIIGDKGFKTGEDAERKTKALREQGNDGVSIIRKMVAESVKRALNETMQGQTPTPGAVRNFGEGFIRFMKMSYAPQNFNELYNYAKRSCQYSYPKFDADAMFEMWVDSYGGSKEAFNAIVPLCRKEPEMKQPTAPANTTQQARKPLRTPEQELELWRAYHGNKAPYGKSSHNPYTPEKQTSYI